MTDASHHGLPDDQTVVTYLEVIHRGVLEARAAAGRGDAERAAEPLDAVHNVPDLLTRWQDADVVSIWRDLEGVAKREDFGAWIERVQRRS